VTPRRLIEPARLAGMAVLRTQTDDRLVDLVRDGNDSAFEAVVHRYRGPLLRYCGRYLSPARAEDAVQQTFVNAVAALRDGDSEINLRPWLYRIAHNASLNVLRQSGADYEQISEQIDGVETPAQALERGERFRSVVAAVRGLPDRQRDALVLQALEGRSYDEIATELGVTGGAVRQLLNRARTTLREGATAFTPPALLARLGGALDAPIADRVAQGAAGAGGGALLAKAAAVVAVAGAVAGGAADGLLTHGSHDRAGAARHVASGTAPARGAASSSAAAGNHLRTVALKRSHPSRRSAATGHGGQAPVRSHRAPSATGEHRSDHSNHDDSGSGGSRTDDGSHHDGTNSGSDGSVATTITDDHSGSSGGSSISGGSDDSRLSTSGPDVTSGTDSSGSGSSGSGSDDGLTSGTSDGTSGTSGGGISGGRG
jgi:RNA polymerase sigma factor (sigma-70 family)